MRIEGVDPKIWLDTLLGTKDPAMQLRVIEYLIDDVHRKTRNRAEKIVQQALLQIGREEDPEPVKRETKPKPPVDPDAVPRLPVGTKICPACHRGLAFKQISDLLLKRETPTGHYVNDARCLKCGRDYEVRTTP